MAVLATVKVTDVTDRLWEGVNLYYHHTTNHYHAYSTFVSLYKKNKEYLGTTHNGILPGGVEVIHHMLMSSLYLTPEPILRIAKVVDEVVGHLFSIATERGWEFEHDKDYYVNTVYKDYLNTLENYDVEERHWWYLADPRNTPHYHYIQLKTVKKKVTIEFVPTRTRGNMISVADMVDGWMNDVKAPEVSLEVALMAHAEYYTERGVKYQQTISEVLDGRDITFTPS